MRHRHPCSCCKMDFSSETDTYCPSCRAVKNRAWREGNPERTRALRAAQRRRQGIPERRRVLDVHGPRPALRVALRALRSVFEAEAAL